MEDETAGSLGMLYKLNGSKSKICQILYLSIGEKNCYFLTNGSVLVCRLSGVNNIRFSLSADQFPSKLLMKYRMQTPPGSAGTAGFISSGKDQKC